MVRKCWQEKVAEAVSSPVFTRNRLTEIERKRPLKIFREALEIAKQRHDPLWARVRRALEDAIKELEWELGGDE
jgi:Tat protein secretion system quality control protein TatD with DNase activity